MSAFQKVPTSVDLFKCGVRLGSKRDDDKKRPYDAFVSFSQHDMDFVRHELIPQLETPDMPYRLCVHHRDWPVGHSISNTIANSVKHSHRTILLLSDNFMKSEWCNYEFQAAHNKVLKNRDCHLIVVLLQDKLPENMDEDMLLYTQTYTYLKRSDPWFWQKLKFAMPKLTTEEITWRSEHPERMQRILAEQREDMARRGLRFQDGAVVEENERNPTELRSQENTEMRASARNTAELRLQNTEMRANERNTAELRLQNSEVGTDERNTAEQLQDSEVRANERNAAELCLQENIEMRAIDINRHNLQHNETTNEAVDEVVVESAIVPQEGIQIQTVAEVHTCPVQRV